jgi:hypothetical protein
MCQLIPYLVIGIKHLANTLAGVSYIFGFETYKSKKSKQL